ncbi:MULTISPECIES: TolC family protein [unclassified Caulobacter]|jgi:cobalt-zinc-cadmium efflux system outer membrane protein|uniref:TolC family protein n=1 Tax=unclassified Caulobacter TaxID=2648921 RepID=UPI000831BAD5|nr:MULTISPECIES: TolC family protein [unclassified Caulobacter]MBQ1560226.1 TolC family protein [Caulobacter sp.]MCK5911024.1 TolC family protein [Caulobacter sp.]PIB96164.1 TolC family protein [Caulobacter sp. X]
MHSRYARSAAIFGAVLALAGSGALSRALAEPLTLDAAIMRAQTQSPLVTAAEASVKAAEGRARQADLMPNPEAGLQSENFAGSGPYGRFGAAETTATISQRLELGGKRRTRAAAANAEVDAARIGFVIAKADLTQEVSVRYAEALAAQDRLALARETATRAEGLSKVAGTLVEAGREPPLRALRAEAASREAAAAVIAAEAEAAAARRALVTLWGDAAETIELVRSPQPATPVMATIDPGETLDVRQARAQLETARAVIDRERAAGRPDLTVQAGVRRFEQTGDSAMIVGFTAPIPISNRNQGTVAAARADATAAEARERLALARSVRAVRDGEAALRAATARLEVLDSKVVPQAQTAVDLARGGFEAGKFSLLEVLDAQAALTTARTELIAARLDRAKALAALERAAAQ